MSHTASDRHERWVKVINIIHRTWALVEVNSDAEVLVNFQDEMGGVFDQLQFRSTQSAEEGLKRNGFEPFLESYSFRSGVQPPSNPPYQGRHPNGRIYSSGLHWRL